MGKSMFFWLQLIYWLIVDVTNDGLSKVLTICNPSANIFLTILSVKSYLNNFFASIQMMLRLTN